VILVDSSIWIEHLRRESATVSLLLSSRRILAHPFVIGEVAVGHLRNRRQILNTLRDLPAAVVASDEEVLEFIDRYLLAGRGLGYIDVHLLAAARLSHAGLWTADKRLQASAELLSLSATP
jgi:predicted nucleic acid-binding protein